MTESWASGGAYEAYMGRWSRRVAGPFVDWLSPLPGQSWLDVGCGSGALSEAVLANHAPASLTAVDPSEGFVSTARMRLGAAVQCRVGNALALPLADASVALAVSGLVLNFLSDPVRALAEMRRVTVPGGTVALYVWDYPGTMDMLTHFWDVAAELDPNASGLHEAKRFAHWTPPALTDLFGQAGLLEIVTAPIEIDTTFKDFDDYWQPFLGGQGPAPTYLLSLDPVDQDRLRERLLERLPIQTDGAIPMRARAWAARARV